MIEQRAECTCGQTYITFYVMTGEVMKELENPCPCCGSILHVIDIQKEEENLKKLALYLIGLILIVQIIIKLI